MKSGKVRGDFMDELKSMVVIKDYATNMWKVYGYGTTMTELYADKSQSKCDDWADNYAQSHNMYYDRTEKAYYKHSKYYRGY